MKNKLFEYLLVAIQFGSLAYFVLSASWLLLPAWVLITVLTGAGFAIWAILSMKVGNFNIIPSPIAGGKLVTHGPYRVIRHPMYTSILLSVIPLLIAEFTVFRISLFFLLIIDLVVKLLYEERLLKVQFDGYEEYSKKTWRIVPGIW